MSQFQWQGKKAGVGGDGYGRRSSGGGAIRSSEALNELTYKLHQRLIEELDPSKLEGLEPDKARAAVETAARTLIAQEMPGIVGATRDDLVTAVADEVLGLGPIEGLVKDGSVSEIMVNAPDTVFYEKEGRIYLSPIRFRDANHIMRVVERIIAPLGRRVDESSPMVDARLADGSRVNVIIPPVAPKSPTITIRKFRQDKLTVEDLIATGTLTREIAEFCRACVQVKLNTVISGGTGTGQDDAPQRALRLHSGHGTHRHHRGSNGAQAPAGTRGEPGGAPPSLEGKGEVTQRDLVRNALRMRPDRIIVGEVRGPEAFDMMQAMNTGHEGSLSTVHANSPRDCLSRVENMILMAGLDLPVRAIREQIVVCHPHGDPDLPPIGWQPADNPRLRDFGHGGAGGDHAGPLPV